MSGEAGEFAESGRMMPAAPDSDLTFRVGQGRIYVYGSDGELLGEGRLSAQDHAEYERAHRHYARLPPLRRRLRLAGIAIKRAKGEVSRG